MSLYPRVILTYDRTPTEQRRIAFPVKLFDPPTLERARQVAEEEAKGKMNPRITVEEKQ